MSFETHEIGPALELRASGDGIIEGLAAPFGERDSYGDTIERGAFAATLKSGRPVSLLWAHDTAKPVGRWSSFEERADGLYARGQLNLKTSTGRDAYEHVKAGDISGLSIGFRVPKGGATFDDKTGLRTLRQVDLFECSIVAIPAFDSARIGKRHLDSMEELRALLRDAGLPHRAADKIAQAGWHVGLGGKSPDRFEMELRQAAKKSADRRSLKSVAELLRDAAQGT